MTAEVSHGRGGAGNIAVDDTQYVDGSIVRTGDVGSHGDGAYSAGRGGAGNIGDVGSKSSERKDVDLVPEQAQRTSDGENRHLGRGGAGNEPPKAPASSSSKSSSPIGLADKLKAKLFGKKK